MTQAAAKATVPPPRRLPPEDFELKEILLHGHRVAYRAAGSGPVIVLVHGITSNSATWERVMPYLATRFTVIAPDLLGHGESAKPRGDYSLGAYASGDPRPDGRARARERHVRRPLARRRSRDAAGLPVPRALRAARARGQRRAGTRGELAAARRHPAGLGDRAPPARPHPPARRRRAVGRAFGRVGLHAGTDMAELARGHASLSDPEARSAFINTLRTIVDPRRSARERQRPALSRRERAVHARVGRARPDHPGGARTGRARAGAVEPAGGVRERGHFPHVDDPQRFLDVLLDFIDSTEAADTGSESWQAMLRTGRTD